MSEEAPRPEPEPKREHTSDGTPCWCGGDDGEEGDAYVWDEEKKDWVFWKHYVGTHRKAIL
jgi:hypothetical protein